MTRGVLLATEDARAKIALAVSSRERNLRPLPRLNPGHTLRIQRQLYKITLFTDTREPTSATEWTHWSRSTPRYRTLTATLPKVGAAKICKRYLPPPPIRTANYEMSPTHTHCGANGACCSIHSADPAAVRRTRGNTRGLYRLATRSICPSWRLDADVACWIGLSMPGSDRTNPSTGTALRHSLRRITHYASSSEGASLTNGAGYKPP